MNADRECVARRHGQRKIRHLEFFTWQPTKMETNKEKQNFSPSNSENGGRVNFVDGIFVVHSRRISTTTACLPHFSRRRNA